jgi:hypothetical protein
LLESRQCWDDFPDIAQLRLWLLNQERLRLWQSSALILVNVCDSSPSEHYAPEGSHKLRESCFFLI